MSETFNIGISAKLRHPDGSVVIAEVDFSALETNPAINVSTLPDIGQGDLTSEMTRNLDAVVLMLERVGEHTFIDPGAQRLSLVARYGVGYDTIDVDSCTQNDVALAIAPEGVRRPVATTVVGLLLALTLRIPEKDRLARDIPVGWETKTQYNGMGLSGRTLGGVGIGNIGSDLFRLMQPFEMRFIAHDPYVDPSVATALGIELVDLDTVFEQADVVTINCPLNAETEKLVNAERLAKMKSSSYLINTSRGPVVDETALIAALESGSIAGAGLDVFELEPPDVRNPLLRMDNVILAPHALCFTDQCMEGLGAADVKACLDLMQGGAPDAVVNREVLARSGFKNRRSDYEKRFGKS